MNLFIMNMYLYIMNLYIILHLGVVQFYCNPNKLSGYLHQLYGS